MAASTASSAFGPYAVKLITVSMAKSCFVQDASLSPFRYCQIQPTVIIRASAPRMTDMLRFIFYNLRYV